MFKVISSAESKEIGHWDIESISTGEVVAYISTYSGYGSKHKNLKVKDKTVCKVKNQDEAIVRLIEFFAENQRAISLNNNNISVLEDDLKNVSDLSKDLIVKEIERLQKVNENLEQYNLK